MNIPEYYKQFQNQPAEKKEEAKKPEQKEQPQKPEQKQETQVTRESSKVVDKAVLYQANTFTLKLLEDWQDKTIYTLTGPVSDGIEHNVVINVDKDILFDTLEEYADWQIKTLETELKGCTLLKKGETKLTNGTQAYEAIFKWYPVEDIRIYQHQIYVLINKVAFKMTASFTKKTRQTIGPAVIRMMLSFNPTQK
ncbi:MAG TPA: DcrB-related protein [Ignavibacteriaceae bacterium]|nr:DcrB-related protein [Ignavibacteriaceae bacterium]